MLNDCKTGLASLNSGLPECIPNDRHCTLYVLGYALHDSRRTLYIILGAPALLNIIQNAPKLMEGAENFEIQDHSNMHV